VKPFEKGGFGGDISCPAFSVTDGQDRFAWTQLLRDRLITHETLAREYDNPSYLKIDAGHVDGLASRDTVPRRQPHGCQDSFFGGKRFIVE
jgi:hypothetical protein